MLPKKDEMYEIIDKVIKKHSKAAKRPVLAGRWVNKSRWDPSIRYLGLRFMSAQRANLVMRDLQTELEKRNLNAMLRRCSPRGGPWSGEYVRMTIIFD